MKNNNKFEKIAKIKFSNMADHEVRSILMTQAEPNYQYIEYIIKYTKSLTDDTMKVLYHKIGNHNHLSVAFAEMKMSPEFVDYLIKNAKGTLLSYVIKCQEISDKVLMEQMPQLEAIDPTIKKTVISEKLRESVYLHKYVTSGSYFERLLVTANPNMTEALLKLLVNDPYRPVASEAQRKLKHKLFKTV